MATLRRRPGRVADVASAIHPNAAITPRLSGNPIDCLIGIIDFVFKRFNGIRAQPLAACIDDNTNIAMRCGIQGDAALILKASRINREKQGCRKRFRDTTRSRNNRRQNGPTLCFDQYVIINKECGFIHVRRGLRVNTVPRHYSNKKQRRAYILSFFLHVSISTDSVDRDSTTYGIVGM